MSDYEDLWEKMIAECERRNWDPGITLNWARAFEAIRALKVKKRTRKKTPNENQQHKSI